MCPRLGTLEDHPGVVLQPFMHHSLHSTEGDLAVQPPVPGLVIISWEVVSKFRPDFFLSELLTNLSS
jgi:hypothetical protein